jgi:hypothetical protein
MIPDNAVWIDDVLVLVSEAETVPAISAGAGSAGCADSAREEVCDVG